MPNTDPEKQKKLQAAHYQANKIKYATASRKARAKKYQKMAELKNKPCTDCRLHYPSYVMQWDHTGTDKVSDVATLMTAKGWAHVLAEVAKCELVCANCHMIRTHRRRILF